jgi:anaphase-promoting complex subunit 1
MNKDVFLSQKYSSDSRSLIVFDWLDATRTQNIQIEKTQDQTDQDFETLKSHKVYKMGLRTISLGIGRGSLFLNRMKQIPDLPIIMSPICLAVKNSISSATSIPDLSQFPAEIMKFPEFHNGVAYALELPKYQGMKVSRGWILQHQKPQSDSDRPGGTRRGVNQEPPELGLDRFSGFLYGLGILGYLNELKNEDIYRLCRMDSQILTSSLLIGLAISGHEISGKLSYMHIFPPDPDVEISAIIQSSSLFALGITHISSNHRLTSELLLGEISKRPISGDKCIVSESEAYSMTAGISLGLVCLGIGFYSASDLQLKSKLIDLVSHRDFPSQPSLASAMHQRPLGDPASLSSLVFEAKPNCTLTAPGGYLAIGLSFWGTNDLELTKILKGPKNIRELENSMKPEILFYRNLAFYMVNWDLVESENFPIIPGFMGEEHIKQLEGITVVEELPSPVDWLLISQSKFWIQASEHIILAVKYAGTSNLQVKQFLLNRTEELVLNGRPLNNLHLAKTSSKSYKGVYPEKYTFDACKAVLLLSLAVVTAGSGDIDVLRLLRIARKKSDESTSYGIHTAIHQALGILFLGGGFVIFAGEEKDSKKKMAYLLISLLPRFPAFPGDNRSSLQIFRHLYALATN